MITDDLLSHFREPAAQGDGSWTAFCPAHPDGTKHGNRSLHISRTGNKWLLKCFNDCPAESILAAAGLAVADLFDESKPRRQRLTIARKALTPRQIEQWWLAARPIAGTLAEVYLRSRGIDLDFSQLLTLRYLPDAPYYAQGKKNPKAHYPCMVAAVGDLSGGIIGIHRTYLAPTGLGKAPEDSSKKMLGAIMPWGVRLSPLPDSGLVRIAEGIETILSIAAVRGLGEAQYVAALSAEELKAWEGPEHNTIEIYADHDPAGQKSADALAVAEKLAGRRAFVFLPPAAGQDFNDVLRAEPAALAAIQGAEREVGADERREAEKPVIAVGNYGLELKTAEAWRALARHNNPPHIFVADHALVRVNSQVTPLDHYGLRHELAKAARWERETTGGATVETLPPLDICHNMIQELEPPLPHLNRVISHWLIDSAGRFITTPGYDPDSGIYLNITQPFKPEPMDVDRAVGIFDDLLSNFHWAAQSDRAHAFALLILPFVREYIRDQTPIHRIEAASPGTGKTLLARVLLSVSGCTSIMSVSPNEDELVRRLDSMVLAQRESVIIDNVTTEFKNPDLLQKITSPTTDIRRFHTQNSVTVRMRIIWALTINNPELSIDMARRSIRIRILSPVEQPDLRTDIKDLELAHTFTKRQHELSSAVYAIVKAWVDAGKPEAEAANVSFPHWAKVMGGVLQTAKIESFLEKDENDASVPIRQTYAIFIEAWWGEHGDSWRTATDLLIAASQGGVFLGKSEKDTTRVWHLGKTLSKLKDQVIGEYKIESRIQRGYLQHRLVKNDNKSENLPF